MREAVPAINLNGFLTADGIWHGFGNEEAAGVLDALQAYATVQYDNLFNKDSAWGGEVKGYRFSRTQAMLPFTVAINSSRSSNFLIGRSQ